MMHVNAAVPESAINDQLDIAIIRSLQLSPRAPFSLLADVLETSEQTVGRRYRRLRRDGILRVTAVVNAPASGNGQNNWVLRVQCKPDGALSLARALGQRDDVGWVSLCSGGTEVVCVMRARSAATRDELLMQRLPRTAPVLGLTASVVLHRYVGCTPDDWAALAGSLTKTQTKRLLDVTQHAFLSVDQRESKPHTVELDVRDRVMLDELIRDGRTSYASLATAAGITEGKATRRVQTLFANDVAYLDVDLSASALGFTAQAIIWLTVAPVHLAAAGHALVRVPEVAFAGAVTGTHNLTATVVCRDLPSLYGFVTDQIGALNGVQSMEVSPVLRVVKQAGALSTGERLVGD